MNKPNDSPDLKTRLFAAVCSCCVFCIGRRMFPDSAYGRMMKQVEKNCPFCRAYDRVHATR